jgi:hypothetical protein
MTTETEFRDLVRKMRLAQKEYFRTRSQVVLGTAKELEKQVDRCLIDQPIEEDPEQS